MTSLYFYPPLFLMHFNFSEEEHISYMQTAHTNPTLQGSTQERVTQES